MLVGVRGLCEQRSGTTAPSLDKNCLGYFKHPVCRCLAGLVRNCRHNSGLALEPAITNINIRIIWLQGYKLFSCSTQLSIKLILLIIVKMPTIVGILTFISRINTTSKRLKARNFLICWYFSFYEQLKFHAQLG